METKRQEINRERGEYTRERRKKFLYLKNTGQLEDYYKNKNLPLKDNLKVVENKTKLKTHMLNGKKSYIIGSLIALIGILASAGVLPIETAQEIIVILLGLLGMALRAAIAKVSK